MRNGHGKFTGKGVDRIKLGVVIRKEREERREEEGDCGYGDGGKGLGVDRK